VAEEKKFRPVITSITETTAFDPEIGAYRAFRVRFEYPRGRYNDLFIKLEEYSPEEAVRRVREWVKRFGRIIGRPLE